MDEHRLISWDARNLASGALTFWPLCLGPSGFLALLALWLSVSTFSILVQHLHLHRGGGYYYGHVIDIGVGLF